MAITFPAVGDGLTRDGSYWSFSPTQEWVQFWFKIPALPGASERYLLWLYGDVTKVNPYIAIWVVGSSYVFDPSDPTPGTGGLVVEVFDGLLTYKSVLTTGVRTLYAGRWYLVDARFEFTGIAVALNSSITGAQLLASPDLDGLPWTTTDEYLGTDTDASLGGATFATVRTFNGDSGSYAVYGRDMWDRSPRTILWPDTDGKLLANTPLIADLLDTSTNGFDWSAVGANSFTAPGPLTLIDSMFSDDFNTVPTRSGVGNQSQVRDLLLGWTPTASGNAAGTRDAWFVVPVGCNQSNALACSSGSDNPGRVLRVFDTEMQASTVRFQLAVVFDGTGTPDPIPILQQDLWDLANVLAVTPDTTGFVLQLFITYDGKIQVAIKTADDTMTTSETSSGVMPVDGSLHGLEITAVITGGNQTINVYIDNDLAITATSSTAFMTAGFDQWNEFALYVTSQDISDAHLFNLIDEPQYEDSVHRIDWPACSGPTFTATSCTFVPPTPTLQRIRRVRRFPLPYQGNLIQFLTRLEVILQAGVGLSDGQGSDPQIMMRISRDGGVTWGSDLWTSAGRQGEFARRAYWNRLGKGRNFVVELAVTDPVFWALQACVIDMQAGTS